MWDCIAGIAARGGLGVAQPWPATAEGRFPKRSWLSATRSVQQSNTTPQSTSLKIKGLLGGIGWCRTISAAVTPPQEGDREAPQLISSSLEAAFGVSLKLLLRAVDLVPTTDGVGIGRSPVAPATPFGSADRDV
jgi:hypothetical protein